MTPRTDSDALLPCPFCGGEEINYFAGSYYCCTCCAEAGGVGISAWNTRADSPAIIALRKERDALKDGIAKVEAALSKDMGPGYPLCASLQALLATEGQS